MNAARIQIELHSSVPLRIGRTSWYKWHRMQIGVCDSCNVRWYDTWSSSMCHEYYFVTFLYKIIAVVPSIGFPPNWRKTTILYKPKGISWSS